MIDLLPPSSLRPDAANPRRSDPPRFDLVTLSLRKFGFLLPLYRGQDGTIYSGHRRTEAAAVLGWDVPVTTLDRAPRDPAGLNLVFNRATNDFSLTDIDHSTVDAIALRTALETLPDAVDRYPCMSLEEASVPELIRANRGRFNRYAANAARALSTYGVDMPVVVGPDGLVVNGIGRLQYASERSRPTIGVVRVSDSRTLLLMSTVMNSLSMDFELNDAFRDELRTNAFRRERQGRPHLGSGYVFPLAVRRCKDVSISMSKQHMRAVFGPRILDFGAGHGDEARMVRRAGIEVLAFEPFRVSRGRPRRALGRRAAREFLKAVRGGVKFSSIILSSVLNSVPFDADRRHVLRVIMSLCSPETTVFAAARATVDPNWKESRTALGLGKSAARSARFVLQDEPGMVLSELNDAPKVQRYFEPVEMAELFEPLFEEVTIGRHINNVTVTARAPRPVDLPALRAALEFEFDLPYKEGRMGLADEAIEAFSKRLGVTL